MVMVVHGSWNSFFCSDQFVFLHDLVKICIFTSAKYFTAFIGLIKQQKISQHLFLTALSKICAIQVLLFYDEV